MFKHILVPLDGFDQSEAILPLVAQFALAMESKVSLVGVIETGSDFESSAILEDVQSFGESRGPDLWNPESIRQWEADLTKYLEMAAERLRSRGIVVSVHAMVGVPHEEIVGSISNLSADMIAMITRRESTLARGILGSVTDRVLRSSDVPVLVAHPDIARRVVSRPNPIVAPVDLSDLSDKMVPLSIELSRIFDAELHFLRVTPHMYYAGLLSGRDSARLYFGARLRQEAIQALQPFVHQAQEAGVTATAEAMSGSAGVRIVEAAEHWDSSLIVMGTLALGGIQRWAMGSVTDKVLRSSLRPVLAVPRAYFSR